VSLPKEPNSVRLPPNKGKYCVTHLASRPTSVDAIRASRNSATLAKSTRDGTSLDRRKEVINHDTCQQQGDTNAA
jgi:hypothetical protein